MHLARSGGLSQLSDEEESDTNFHSSDQIKHKSSLSAERGNDTVGMRRLSAKARKRSSVQSGDRESVVKAQRDDSIRR